MLVTFPEKHGFAQVISDTRRFLNLQRALQTLGAGKSRVTLLESAQLSRNNGAIPGNY